MAGTLTINHLTKIEGHATLTLQVDGVKVKKCELSSIEGSRYFEGIVKGRRYDEAPEITSRICGICSCAHTIAAIMAVEDGFGVQPSKQTMQLRKLLTIGERIRSHATHLYFLALPDYFGVDSAIAMLPKHKKEVQRALRLMKAGNEIIRTVGGRDLHPVSAQVGGFLRVPSAREMRALRESLKPMRADALATAKLFGNLKIPEFERKTDCLSLYTGRDYPILEGRLKCETREFERKDYGKYFREYQEPYSTANFVVKEGKSYMVGALARVNNNFKFLHPSARKIAADAGVVFPKCNPFLNNFAQSLELVHYAEESVGLCEKLENAKFEPLAPARVGKGKGATGIEVPRGILWHYYEFDDRGVITGANIVTPTAQNLRNMQDDIRALLPGLLGKAGKGKGGLSKEKIVLEVEKLIRSYDPCFSCSTHFLKVKWLKGKKN